MTMDGGITVTQLKALRLRLRISLLEVAAQSGLPESYLAQIENGAVRASTTDLERIERTLKFIEKENAQPDDDGERKLI